MKTLWVASDDNTPLGRIWVAYSEVGLAAVEFEMPFDELRARLQRRFGAGVTLCMAKAGDAQGERAMDAAGQLAAYLRGERKAFELEIDWGGMGAFQEMVLRQTFAIPYGQTCTYAELARRVGKPLAARAVGRAQATNPMPLVIPCHRVVGSDGKLHGYGGIGGIATKQRLLDMEQGRVTTNNTNLHE